MRMKCIELVTYGSMGRLPVPRACKQNAIEGSAYCGSHHHRREKRKVIPVVQEGGFCVWCAGPARAYSIPGGTTISLCKKCGDGLARAIVDGR